MVENVTLTDTGQMRSEQFTRHILSAQGKRTLLTTQGHRGTGAVLWDPEREQEAGSVASRGRGTPRFPREDMTGLFE